MLEVKVTIGTYRVSRPGIDISFSVPANLNLTFVMRNPIPRDSDVIKLLSQSFAGSCIGFNSEEKAILY